MTEHNILRSFTWNFCPLCRTHSAKKLSVKLQTVCEITFAKMCAQKRKRDNYYFRSENKRGKGNGEKLKLWIPHTERLNGTIYSKTVLQVFCTI